MANLPNLSTSFTWRSLTDALNIAFEPLFLTKIVVKFGSYPKPPLITTTSTILPLEISGLRIAPVPVPLESLTTSSGKEKYSSPPLNTCTSTMRPFEITGFNCAFFPFFNVTSGFLWRFSIVEPYPTPLS